MSATQKITTEKRGHLWLIGVNRAEKMNAFDPEMLTALSDAFTAYEDDRELRCAVIYANGDHFTAGLDLAKVAPLIQGGQEGLIGDPSKVDPWAMHGRPRTKPTVLAVHGRCLTLGIELALAQDITIAAENTRFGQIEIKRGIFPFGGATFRFVQRAGWGNAMRWLLTGDEFDAQEALRIGLVQEVVPVGRQLDRALELAETVAAQATLAVQATIVSARRAFADQAAIAALMPEVARLMATDDAREGLMSFLERRKAQFTGK